MTTKDQLKAAAEEYAPDDGTFVQYTKYSAYIAGAESMLPEIGQLSHDLMVERAKTAIAMFKLQATEEPLTYPENVLTKDENVNVSAKNALSKALWTQEFRFP